MSLKPLFIVLAMLAASALIAAMTLPIDEYEIYCGGDPTKERHSLLLNEGSFANEIGLAEKRAREIAAKDKATNTQRQCHKTTYTLYVL